MGPQVSYYMTLIWKFSLYKAVTLDFLIRKIKEQEFQIFFLWFFTLCFLYMLWFYKKKSAMKMHFLNKTKKG